MAVLDWRPTATRAVLERRARLFADIRAFFAARGVLEVDTPLVSGAMALDPNVQSLRVIGAVTRGRPQGCLYLQTSPEYAMKRLLAAFGMPIYQLSKAFRDDESGSMHNPEFTLLEWYRPGFDEHALMDEVEALIGQVAGAGRAQRITYRAAFGDALGVDPLTVADGELQRLTVRAGLDAASAARLERNACLDLLFSQGVQPRLARGAPVFVHDFPASQAALARIRSEPHPVAERFELFWDGVELANGYRELVDPAELRTRMEGERRVRGRLGQAVAPLDERLLAAAAHGLPDCAGVALGVDRLLMVALGLERLEAALAFPLDRA